MGRLPIDVPRDTVAGKFETETDQEGSNPGSTVWMTRSLASMQPDNRRRRTSAPNLEEVSG